MAHAEVDETRINSTANIDIDLELKPKAMPRNEKTLLINPNNQFTKTSRDGPEKESRPQSAKDQRKFEEPEPQFPRPNSTMG
jgi:hypothetical protein